MKISTASATVSVFLAVAAFAADPPNPASKPAKPSPAQKEKPPTLTLDAPYAPIAPKPATPNLQLAPAAPLVITPATPAGPKEDTGPAITLNDKNAPLVPGVYIASPYTGIVVVPAPIDHPMVKRIGPGRDRMPMAVPDLKLTPKAK
jgi:hypothetical protein